MISRHKAWKIQEDRTMIKLIVGAKGSGKTKAMIDQINDAVKTSKGKPGYEGLTAELEAKLK